MLRKTVAYLVAVIFMFSAAVLSAQEPDAEMQQVYQEYMTLNQELQALQQQVFEDPEVAEMNESFQKLLDEKIIEIDPEAATILEQQAKIEGDFMAAVENEDQEQLQELQQQYQTLDNQLRPLIDEAMQKKSVQEEQMKLEELVFAKMIEIEPGSQEKLDRIESLQMQLEQMMPAE
ncbi:MAG: hypothetical protein R6U84_10820 [Candidatus Cloacimonadales bacterium]